MRFPVVFKRQKGSTSTDPLIGTDPDPRVTQQAPSGKKDNCLFAKIRDVNGWPVQRIAVFFTTTAAAPTAFNMDLYCWEAETQAWVKINDAALSVKPGQLFFFDVCAIGEATPTQATLAKPGSPAQAGSLELQLVVVDPGAQVAGVFSIAMGPDLTTVGT